MAEPLPGCHKGWLGGRPFCCQRFPIKGATGVNNHNSLLPVSAQCPGDLSQGRARENKGEGWPPRFFMAVPEALENLRNQARTRFAAGSTCLLQPS